MRNFAHCSKIKDLDLSSPWSAITDAGLCELAACKELETLRLRGIKVNGSCFAALEQLPFKKLFLQETAVTDENLKFIGKLKDLEVLVLDKPRSPTREWRCLTCVSCPLQERG